jgi:hypothetical protein
MTIKSNETLINQDPDVNLEDESDTLKVVAQPGPSFLGLASDILYPDLVR